MPVFSHIVSATVRLMFRNIVPYGQYADAVKTGYIRYSSIEFIASLASVSSGARVTAQASWHAVAVYGTTN
jgi:hypothetical protein